VFAHDGRVGEQAVLAGDMNMDCIQDKDAPDAHPLAQVFPRSLVAAFLLMGSIGSLLLRRKISEFVVRY
jgi:hypothetical protein